MDIGYILWMNILDILWMDIFYPRRVYYIYAATRDGWMDQLTKWPPTKKQECKILIILLDADVELLYVYIRFLARL